MIRNYHLFTTLAGLILAASVVSADDLEAPKVELGTLKVRITGLRSDKGTVHLALFNTRESFSKRGMEFRKLTVKPDAKTALAEIPELPFGEYAIAMYHDENDNNKHNKGLFLILMEKYGFSNNAKPGLKGPPDFEKAKFFLLKEQKTITIKAQ